MLSSTAFRVGQPLQHHRRDGSRAGRRTVQPPQALFGFLASAKPKASSSQAQELVSQLLELTERTDCGLKASAAKHQQIAELVDELESFCPRNPLRSPLLFGKYEVVYASNPRTAGGPFRSQLGRIIFPGQRALQSLQPPNICINEVTYKTLGFIPGSACQEGVFTLINSNTLQMVFPDLGCMSTDGPLMRIIQIAYLDDRVRVARAIPHEGGGAEPCFYVLRRLVEDKDEEEEEDEVQKEAVPKRGPFAFGTRKIRAAVQEQEEAPPSRRSMLGTKLLGRKDSLATMAEKRYAQQKSGSRGTGTAVRFGTGTVGRGGAGSTVTAHKTREEIVAERSAARAAAEEERRSAQEAAEEQRRAAREAAVAAKAAADEERRARQAQLEAERARVAELKETARKQLAQLQGEASEAVDAAKAAAVVAKETEKSASVLLQQANQARGLIDQAASAATSALQQVESLKLAEKEAMAAVAKARSSLKELQFAGGRR